jgi:hypothetical protein
MVLLELKSPMATLQSQEMLILLINKHKKQFQAKLRLKQDQVISKLHHERSEEEVSVLNLAKDNKL